MTVEPSRFTAGSKSLSEKRSKHFLPRYNRCRRQTKRRAKTDFLFPPQQQHELAEQLSVSGRQLEYVELESIQGHDSFLVDMDRFRPTIARFFATED